MRTVATSPVREAARQPDGGRDREKRHREDGNVAARDRDDVERARRLKSILERRVESGPVTDQDRGSDGSRSGIVNTDPAGHDLADVHAQIGGPLSNPRSLFEDPNESGALHGADEDQSASSCGKLLIGNAGIQIARRTAHRGRKRNKASGAPAAASRIGQAAGDGQHRVARGSHPHAVNDDVRDGDLHPRHVLVGGCVGLQAAFDFDRSGTVDERRQTRRARFAVHGGREGPDNEDVRAERRREQGAWASAHECSNADCDEHERPTKPDARWQVHEQAKRGARGKSGHDARRQMTHASNRARTGTVCRWPPIGMFKAFCEEPTRSSDAVANFCDQLRARNFYFLLTVRASCLTSRTAAPHPCRRSFAAATAALAGLTASRHNCQRG